MFFLIFGWLISVLLCVGFIGSVLLQVLFFNSFGGCERKKELIPFFAIIIIFVIALIGLVMHSPFHLTISR